MNEDRNIFEDGSWQGSPYNTPFEDVIVKEAKGVFSRYNLALFLYTAVAYAIIFAVQIILGLTLPESTLAEISGSVWYQWLMGVGPMYLVGFPLLILIVKGMPRQVRLKKKLDISEFFALLLVGEAFMVLGNLIGTSLMETVSLIIGRDIENSTSILIEESPLWLIFTIVVIVGPIIEELLFRKLMIDRFSKYGDKLAIIFSAVAFGLFHGNFYQFFYAAALGLLLGYVYTKTGDVKYTILLHMAINFLGSIAPMPVIELQEYLMPFLMGEVGMEELNLRKFIVSICGLYSYTIIQYAMAIGGAVIFFNAIKYRRIEINRYPAVKIPSHRTAEAALLNVGTILYLIFSCVILGASIFLT